MCVLTHRPSLNPKYADSREPSESTLPALPALPTLPTRGSSGAGQRPRCSIALAGHCDAVDQQAYRWWTVVPKGSRVRYLTLLAEGRRNLHGVLEHVAHRNFGSLLSYFNPIKLPVLVRVQVSGAAQPRPPKWRRSTRPRTHSLLP